MTRCMNTYRFAVTSSLLLSLSACSAASNDVSPVSDTSGPHDVPAAAPLDAPAPTGTGTSVFALRDVRYGDIDATGASTATAWQSIGFDIDGYDTTAASTDVCQLAAGSPRATQIDGLDGIDNSFGENILPVLMTLLGNDMSSVFDKSLEQGAASTLLAVDRLGTDANASPLTGGFYLGAPMSAAPKWDGTDRFPVDAVSFDDSNRTALTFSQGYVSNGLFVTSPTSSVGTIALGALRGAPFTLPITHVQLQMKLSSDSSSASDGVLSAIVPTDAFITYIASIAGNIWPSLCGAGSLAQITTQLEQASDILVDGTQDPKAACDGISVGLGFSATRVNLGAKTDVAPASTPCVAH